MGCLHWSRLMKPAGVREDSMIIRYLLLVAAAALTLGGPAHAVEINVLSTNALKTVLEELGPKFEESSGQKLTITWGTTAQLKTQIEGGAAFDAAVVTDAVADDLIKQGKLATRTALARSGIAVAIKKGAPKPDLHSADDLKKMLLSAKSIAWVEQGQSGIYLKGVFERLGVAEQIKDKLISVKAAGQAVANGEAEIGFTQISEVLPYAGAEVGGMLPPDVQLFTNFSIGIRDKDSAPAEALVKFLTAPAAATVIKLKGLEPL
jgi:molybdate transport system substrate-binding protein